MKKPFTPLGILLLISLNSNSQDVTCGQAVAQLQSYAIQVNNFYQDEYWRVIPNVRCPPYTVNQWNQPIPVNPQIVQNCRWQMLSYLNQWYGVQCQYVNNWYAQIARGCLLQQPTTVSKPAPGRKSGDGENSQIDTEEIDNLTVGIDEEKALKITIPKTASGYKPRY